MKYNSESGRSMVEMLGTLAIIGVLSIAGISGYRHAILRYKANETIQELTLRSVIHSQQIQAKATLNQDEMGSVTKQGFPITVSEFNQGFQITINNVDHKLCQTILRLDWGLPTQIQINGNIDNSLDPCVLDKNNMSFLFLKDLQKCTSDTDCICGTCDNGKCMNACSVNDKCTKSFDDGKHTCCPKGNIVNGVCCAHPGENGTCCDSQGKYCCPPDKPLLDAWGNCRACEEKKRHIQISHTITSEPPEEIINICHRCSNRKFYMGYVAVCSIPCPPDKPLTDHGKEDCYACDANITFSTSWYMNDSKNSMNQLCRLCPGRTVTDGIVNACRKCELNADSFSVKRKEDCDRCPGRVYFGTGYGHYCAWKCKKSTDIMDSTGHCYTCQEPEEIDTKGIKPDGGLLHRDAGECQKCSGKRFLGSWLTDKRQGDPNWSTVCYRCDDPAQYVYLGSYAGKDYPSLCEACGNRRSFNHYCAKYCEEGKVWDTKGLCHTCDEAEDFDVKGVPENKCACPGVRYLDGNICKKCPVDVSGLTEVQKQQCQK